MYTLYVIPGSHACRAAILMLEHKGVPYKRVDFVTGLHPLAARLRGFEKPREQRTAGGKRPFGATECRPYNKFVISAQSEVEGKRC